jgi:ABC-type lipoprotein export system ATPase subunit
MQEKLIQTRTSLPQIISSYDANQLHDIVVDDDDISSSSSNNSNNNNNKWIEYICKFIHLLSTFIQLCYPLVTITV